MTSLSAIHSVVQAVAGAAGWKTPQQDSTGVFVFHLEGGLVLELFSPDNWTGVLKGDLGPVPQAPDTELRLSRLASLSVRAMKKRGGVLSLSSGTLPARLELTRTFDLPGLAHPSARHKLLGLARDFLNDLAWWRRQTRGNAGEPAPANLLAPPPGWVRL